MKNILCVALGGAFGSVLRYLISMIPVSNANGFPLTTLLINILGSFLIGLIAALSGRHAGIPPETLLLLKTGICGGFTTFSTFALESSALIQNGKISSALIYIAASIIFSLSAVFAAQLIVR